MALDTETMEGQPDRDTFLGIFYEHYVHWLVEPFWLGDLSEGAVLRQSYLTIIFVDRVSVFLGPFWNLMCSIINPICKPKLNREEIKVGKKCRVVMYMMVFL